MCYPGRSRTRMEADLCVAALDQALRQACPEISNTDQGSQFASEDYLGRLERAGVRVSMDGRGRFLDNIFVERPRKTLSSIA